MIELPEAATIAKQIKAEVRGKKVVGADTGTSPHKWVFYAPERKALETRLRGKTVDDAGFAGRAVRLSMSSGRILMVDDFGGRVTFHEPGDGLPKKYHLLLRFDDDSALSVAIQGWGFIALATERQITKRNKARAEALSPVVRRFTLKHFNSLFDPYEGNEKDPIKTFFTNGRNVAGIGNGYLQDILFRARIDPRRKVGDIKKKEQTALHKAVKETIAQAIALGGRECERDLYGGPGKCRPVMDRYAAGKPCTVCGTTIQKISYLGGSCYICPQCQV
jgi:formamidopyrimidine-DNA glycosylase